MMEVVILNPQKGRLETIDATINESNSTWFDDNVEGRDINTITDLAGNLLIKDNSHSYPVLVYDVTRDDIGHDQQKAKILRDSVLQD